MIGLRDSLPGGMASILQAVRQELTRSDEDVKGELEGRLEIEGWFPEGISI